MLHDLPQQGITLSAVLQARPEAGGAELQAGGSVPGTVSHTAGGVARNIAVGLAQRLGCAACGKVNLKLNLNDLLAWVVCLKRLITGPTFHVSMLCCLSWVASCCKQPCRCCRRPAVSRQHSSAWLEPAEMSAGPDHHFSNTRRPGVPPPLLVSCVGRDGAGGALMADLAARGLPLRGVLQPPGAATATVSIVSDGSGEVAHFRMACCSFLLRSQWDCIDQPGAPFRGCCNASCSSIQEVCSQSLQGCHNFLQVAAAVADVSALERALTPAVLSGEFSHDIAVAPLVVVDANMSLVALQVRCTPSL